MRSTTLSGKEDGLKCELGSDVSLIAAVMEIGRCTDPSGLIFEATFSGKELKAFLLKHAPGRIALWEDLRDDNTYTLTAYDW